MQEYPDPFGFPPQQRRRVPVYLVVGGLALALLVGSCVVLALTPFLASDQESADSRAFQVLFSALFALLGLLLMLTERQLRQIGWPHASVSLARLLFTSASGLTFWTGLALLGIALARLEAPAYASPLNVLFWSVVGLWLLAELLLTVGHLARPRRVRAPDRDADT